MWLLIVMREIKVKSRNKNEMIDITSEVQEIVDIEKLVKIY